MLDVYICLTLNLVRAAGIDLLWRRQLPQATAPYLFTLSYLLAWKPLGKVHLQS